MILKVLSAYWNVKCQITDDYAQKKIRIEIRTSELDMIEDFNISAICCTCNYQNKNE
jgi:hypothetical protein